MSRISAGTPTCTPIKGLWQAELVKIILIIVDLVICVALTILAMVQSKDDAGLSSTITGSSSNNFFEKNKSRTKEGLQKKWSIILGIAFVIVTIALSIVYIA